MLSTPAFVSLYGCGNPATGIPAAIARAARWADADQDQAAGTTLRISAVEVTTIIEFDLPVTSIVSVSIYGDEGTVVAILLDRAQMDAGSQEVSFDASNLSSGMYIFVLRVNPLLSDGTPAQGVYVATRKMLLIK